jgi:diadenosine tetraphosphate (Ap4A) HIT family hydrolase
MGRPKKTAHDCRFCSPQDWRRISWHEHWTSLLSDPRLAEGHALVVPNRHITRLEELSDAEVASIMQEVMRLSLAIVAEGYGTGYEIRIKFEPWEPDGPVHLSHLHIHVIPRNPGDGLFGATETGRETGAFTPLLQSDDVLSKLMPNWRKNRHWH